MEQKEQHDWVSLQNDIGKTPLHLAAGQGGVLVRDLWIGTMDLKFNHNFL